MANNVVSIENSKKHWTNQEKRAREEAENNLKRQTVRLVAPKRIKENKAAIAYWNATKKRLKGVDMLDDLDIDMLAIYCEQMARRDKLQEFYDMKPDSDSLKELQNQERLIMQYADKLGLTPNGRMRLAKKRAEEKLDEKGDLFG